MAYIKTNWEVGPSYGPEPFNKIENAIESLDIRMTAAEGGGISGSGLYQLQTTNMAKALKKLRTNVAVEICFMGDSVFYGYNQGPEGVPEDCIPDNGKPLTGYKRSPITIYDSFMEKINEVYENCATLKKKIYTGQSVKRANTEWNASNSDIIIMNYGINDAMGSHIDATYRGNIDMFCVEYRKLIERELKSGTAVIILSPTRETMLISGTDVDNRAVIDAYEQAVFNICKEYHIPCIDGNEITKNLGNDLSIDFCHFSPKAFEAIGYRLASVLIGQSPNRPFRINSNSYMGVNPQIDNVNIVTPAVLASSNISPNIPMMLMSEDLSNTIQRVDGGLQANISGFGKVVWSFYCEQDGMVVVPNFYTENAEKVRMSLDFGALQGQWSNYWNNVNNTTIDRTYKEPSVVDIVTSTLSVFNTGKRVGLFNLSTTTPVIKIVSKGWHTLTIELPPKQVQTRSVTPPVPADGAASIFGINILSAIEYKMLTKV